jgi:hypothetical protein
MANVVGVVKVIIDEVDYGTLDGATLDLGGDKNTPVMASGRLIGPSAEPMPAVFKGNFVPSANSAAAEAVRTLNGKTVRFETNVQGLSYASSNCFSGDTVKLSKGGVDFEIYGEPATKVG